MRCTTISENLLKPIQHLHSADKKPVIKETREPLVALKSIKNRLFIRSSYYDQKIPNSLQSIYLRQGVTERLNQALAELPKSYSFIVYDGYRPLQVQQFLFDQVQQEIALTNPSWSEQEVQKETLKYVAYPSIEEGYPAPHLTGGAVDLTLGDSFGNPLDLGTAFDETNSKSATAYFETNADENPEAFKNRRLLFNCMTSAGFKNYSEEWWHYDFGNVTWARKAHEPAAFYGAIIATIEKNELKEYRYK
ncbi:D-alanyl-D-alanine dipeptidase [Solibacillus sp. R5-41]|uniref:M15 family metallopeptidase n=1 Tax=Solibacillus sp. R5-41 TaxID=2048654 RepID=UPI000C124F13|nr:M15 family metallopeptidase [Solibacillus sp. R5-41]ATP41155.1 D-alanyl-D-alanine dipeptidase [Solibacillus sp. R5-41]